MIDDDEPSYHYFRRMYFLRRRRLLVLLLFGSTVSLATYYGLRLFPPLFGIQPVFLATLSLAFGFFPMFFFTYLGSGSISQSSAFFLHRIERLEHLVHDREREVDRVLETIHLDDNDKDRLVAEAKASILESAKAGALEEIKASLQHDESERRFSEALLGISRRLGQEIEALRRRSNVNLFIGIFLGISGLMLLGFVAFREIPAQADPKSFLLSSIPRLSLGVLVEFLAYFFLRLYKAAAPEIRYFHNELTNQEARTVALMAARKHPNSEPLIQALAAFLQTERNFVLSKDQSTVFLEQRKLDNIESQALVSTLENLVSKAVSANARSKDGG